MSRELVVLAGLEFGQELRDSALHLGEFRNERIAVHYREITRYTANCKRWLEFLGRRGQLLVAMRGRPRNANCIKLVSSCLLPVGRMQIRPRSLIRLQLAAELGDLRNRAEPGYRV
jgi:hypothetical protein